MMRPQLRTLFDRLNRWRWETVRPVTRRVSSRVRAVLPSLPLPLGWAFLTWSMFLWQPRAWAASVGVYLFLTGIMPAVEVYIKARANARRSRIDQ